MIFIFWVLNFAISWFNAWGCGKTWNESKQIGGLPHFMNWCGAIMSASGFTWCYLVILGEIGTVIPIEQDDGSTVPLLAGATAQAFADLGYTIVIFPILGSGLALTLHSWWAFWKRRNLRNGATAAWNTFAQGYDIMHAVSYLPGSTSRLGDFFGGSSGGDSDSGKGFLALVVIFLVACAAIGGILTTRAIIKATARATVFNRRLEYLSRRIEQS